jgi:hypothetical protein
MTRPFAALLGALLALTIAAPAQAAFPYKPQGAADDYSSYRLPAGANQTPGDLDGKREWMYSSTADPAASPTLTADARELYGVRGAHVADKSGAPQAWHVTTGRPDVTISVLDSGVKWNDAGAMVNLRKKTRISRGETPVPQADRVTALEPDVDCATYAAAAGKDERDLNRDGVFNIIDFACDSRVDRSPARGAGPADMLDPQDVLIAFTDGTDADGNGYADDIVGWDFLDDDNDPFDDVQYAHGTGQAQDSAAEADNGGDLGTCPNCMQIHLRVGTSFVADVNRFAMAVLYAVDNDVLVVQEALGTLNKSRIGADAVRYAYDHGVAVIASAADEAAQHHNWPSSYPYVIVVNSVTHIGELQNGGTYLAFNGCTNFSSRVTLAIPSVTCSSDATGRAAGMAGLVQSAALNAVEKGDLTAHPTCRRTNGKACALSANEVRQVMASGLVNGQLMADDVNFSGDAPELACQPVPVPGCTDPFLAAPATQARFTAPHSYPARKGFDQFYGYGRVNMKRTVDAVAESKVLPEVEITSPSWYETVDPAKPVFDVRGQVWARGATYTCQVLVAAGSYPSDATDFVPVDSAVCNGQPRTEPVDGLVASVSTEKLKSLFPPNAGLFTGREPGLGEQIHSGRPNTEPYGFHVKIVAKAGQLTGQDRRNAYLHRDADMLPGFPMQLPGDGEASPTLADLDGDNRNELIVANSDGVVHAFRRNGSELPGFPVHTDPLPLHTGQRAFASGDVNEAYGAVLATPAVGDLDRDGTVEIVLADMEGRVYVLNADGTRRRQMRSSLAYAGVPQAPFANTREGHRNRTQLGFIGAPVLADLDGNDRGELEIVAAAMDRHVYAWNADGSTVPGWPALVVDYTKVASVDPATHRVRFKDGLGEEYDQGAIVATPAVGDVDGDGKADVVVGTNESYELNKLDEGPLNAGGLDGEMYKPLGAVLALANGRLYALKNTGDPDGPGGKSPYLAGWPTKIGILQAGILPLVGEGITGSPIIGSVRCDGAATPAPTIGVIPAVGAAYLLDGKGDSCLGKEGDRDVVLPTSGGTGTDQPFLPAFGHPAFGKLNGQSTFLAPAAGAQRALDAVLPDYQGGHDYLVAWNTLSGRFTPGWPAEVNDLSFLTGPSVADVDGLPGEEVVTGTASDDLQGFNGSGADMSAAWPKLSGDWTVANPAVGSFGTLDSDPAAKKVVVGMTRSGRITAYQAAAPACSEASWPRFHHDNANSGDARRDAIAPGRPMDGVYRNLGVVDIVEFTPPGDDLLCGTPAKYELRQSDSPITAANWAAAAPMSGTVESSTATRKLIPLPANPKRYVGVRAVDEQGNVGQPLSVGVR